MSLRKHELPNDLALGAEFDFKADYESNILVRRENKRKEAEERK